ncbi:MAG: hypothetical protein AAFW84_06065 [Cyanobacteria bacterium J06635_15]
MRKIPEVLLKSIYSQHKEVSLKIKTRPLRCAYLVRSRDDLLNAITLYTHTWGGAANVILPAPKNEEEINESRLLLSEVNPDYFFIPREYSEAEKAKLTGELSILCRPISHVNIEKYAGEEEKLHLKGGILSHVNQFLTSQHQNLKGRISTCLIEENDRFKLEMALHIGCPSEQYRSYLLNHLDSKSITCSDEDSGLLKALLSAIQYYNPYLLTLYKITKTYSENRDRENPHESPLPHHPASGSAQGGSSESFRNQNPLGF